MMSATDGPDAARRRRAASGATTALSAFALWGISPIYFKASAAAHPLEILAHRVIWSVVMLAALLAARGRLVATLQGLRNPRRLSVYLATTTLIGCNWLIFIWALTNDRVLDASLGYFINPLVNVALGVAFLSERLNRRQGIAIGLATAGVGAQVVVLGSLPWVSLSLALTFGFYALIRKRTDVDPVGGLLLETLLLLPASLICVAVMAQTGTAAFATGWWISILLLSAGAVTSVPLILFTHGAQRLPLKTIGVMQYIAPTLHFLLATQVYGEPFHAVDAVTFGCIWAGLAVYSADAVRRSVPARSRA